MMNLVMTMIGQLAVSIREEVLVLHATSHNSSLYFEKFRKLDQI